MNAHHILPLVLLASCLWAPISYGEIPLRDFARKPEFTKVKLSPAGDHLAVTLPVDDATSLAVIRLADRKVVGTLRFNSKEHVTDFWWASPTRILLTIAIQDGPLAHPQLTGELFAMDADGGRKAYLFGLRGEHKVNARLRRAAPISAFARMVDPLPEDPDHVLVSLNYWPNLREGKTDVVRMNIFTAAYSIVATAPEPGWAYFLADPAGEVRYTIVGGVNNKYTTYWREPNDPKWRRDHAAESATTFIEPLAFSKDGSSVYLKSDEPGDKSCLVRRSLGERAGRQVLACHDRVDLEDVLLSFDGAEAVAALFHPDEPELRLLKTKHPDTKLLPSLVASFGSNFVLPVSRSLDGSRLVLRAYSDRNPGDYYLFDRKTNRAEYLLSERSWIKPETMAERKPFSYKTRDGHSVFGYLTIPPGRKAELLPMVVMPHGGPFGVRDHWHWEADPQMLASRGYAVLQANFRGSEGYGRKHGEAGYGNWGTVMVDDITDGAKWAIGKKIADPDRLCIYGGSYGAYAAMMSAVRNPDLYRCVIAYAGVYDLNRFAKTSDVIETRRGRNFIRDFVGATEEARTEQSPLTHIDALKAPVMIVHGKQDRRTPFEQAELLREALEERRHPYVWLVKREEGHGFYMEKNQEELYQRMLEFLDEHIGSPRSG